MVEEYRVLHIIRLERNEHIYVESILIHLETNLYRPRVLGIKKVDISLVELTCAVIQVSPE
jgi:hypothetical protein